MNLVNIADYWVRGKLYYVQIDNLKKYNISKEDLEEIGIHNDNVYVVEEVVNKLCEINRLLHKEWLELVVKDGYRSIALYELVYKKRCEIFWKEETDKILNMDRKIHATGYAVDVSIASVWGTELKTKFWSHGEGQKYGQEQYSMLFFEHSTDPEEQEMHHNRMKLYNLMTEQWFVLWTLNEYWHFELPYEKSR